MRTIKLLALDFDGVLTDNRVWTDENGVESVACCRSDGIGIRRCQDAGIRVVVLSTETNPVVSARCRKLRVSCLQGLADKRKDFLGLIAAYGIKPAEAAFVGNDINDLGCLAEAGFKVAVADAWPEVLEVADYVTVRKGGYGAVREVCDLLMETLCEH